jgi:hypothetical protein
MKNLLLILSLFSLFACSKEGETFDPWGKWSKANCARYGYQNCGEPTIKPPQNDVKSCDLFGNCDAKGEPIKSCDLFGNCGGDSAPSSAPTPTKSCDLYGNCE